MIDSVDTFAKPIPGAVFSQGNEVIIPASDVTSSGIARASAIIQQGIMLGGDINVVRPTNSLSSIFLALVLSHGRTQRALLKRAKGTSVVHLHNSDIQDVSINYPSSIEQMKLGGFFRQLDSIIALCQRKLDLLTQAKKALMQQIFTQKLRFKADDGSDFPEWEEKKLGDMTILRNGYAFSSSTYVPCGHYHILTIANVQGDRFATVDSSTNTIDELPENLAHWQVLKENDILISLTGNVGRVSLNHGLHNLLNQRVGVLEVKSKHLGKEYLYQRISSTDFKQAMTNAGQGAAQKNISKYDIENFNIKVPSLPEQKKIASCLSSADALIDQARTDLEQWQEVKKSLLQQMFV